MSMWWYLGNGARCSRCYYSLLIESDVGLWPIEQRQFRQPWVTFKVIHPLHAFLVFTALRYASAVYAAVTYPSVCPPYAGIAPKRLNVGSRKQRLTIAHGFWLSDAHNYLSNGWNSSTSNVVCWLIQMCKFLYSACMIDCPERDVFMVTWPH